FTDGAWREDNRIAGLAWIFENPDGSVKSQYTSLADFIGSPLTVEAMAVKMALAEVINLDLERLCVVSDSKVLIQALSTKNIVTEIYGILLEIFNLLSFFWEIHFRFTPREANLLADSLAKQSFRESSMLADRNVRGIFPQTLNL
ncbi:hypothetical protein EUTSA_v10024129mg, partial [Eutrema salsugineum]